MEIIICELARGEIINLSTVDYSVTSNREKYLPTIITFIRQGGEPSGWLWASLQRQRVSLLGGGEQPRRHGGGFQDTALLPARVPITGISGCWFNVGKSHRRLPLGPEMLLDLSTSSRPRPTFHQLPSVTVAAICPPGDQPVLARCRAESRGHRNDSQWLSRRGRELCVSWQPTGEESTGV